MYRIIAVVSCWLLALPAVGQETLASRLEKVIRRPEYKQAHWGLLVVDAKTGDSIYEHSPDRLFAPASTTKLFSCATALTELGPKHRFETPVYRQGDDLILVASGDLTLGGRTLPDGTMAFTNGDHTYASPTSTTAAVTSTDPLAGLVDLATQIRQAGITRVRDVLIDDRLFSAARGSGSGPDLLVPIIVNDNVVDLLVEPGSKPGAPAKVTLRPDTGYVQVDAHVETAKEGAEPKIEVRTVGPQRITVRGWIAAGGKPAVRIWPVDDPARFARFVFIETLRRAGVRVESSPHAAPGNLPPSAEVSQLKRVALHTSLPLSEAIKVTLKVSHNLYASTLPLLVAVKHHQSGIGPGLRLQRRFLMDLGVPADTISFAGGAGGMQADMVTPRAAVQLIQAMRKRPEYAPWHAALPILGVDGTLWDVVEAKSPARGMVQAKTGTLWWYDEMNSRNLLRSKALAGVMTTATGRELSFAIFVNDVPLPPGTQPTREGKVLGHLCELLYQHAP